MENHEIKKLPLSVLYVEDDPDIRENTHEILKRRIKQVWVAANGVDGLDVYKEHGADVVITDIKMPRMDGLTMAEHIRRIKPEQHLIIISAYNEIEYLSKAIELGVDGFVLKPLQWSRLIDLIRKIADSIRLERELIDRNQQIAEKQALLESMLNSSTSVAIITTDSAYQITNLNQVINQWRKEHYLPGIGISNSLLTLWPSGKSRDNILVHLKNALEGKPVNHLEDTIWDLAKENIYELSIWPIQSPDMVTVSGLTIMITDVTERRRATEQLDRYRDQLEEMVKQRTDELLESEFRYQKLIERLNDALMITRENTIVYANPALARLIGLDSKVLIGENILRLFSHEAAIYVNEIHQQRLQGKPMPEIYETAITTSNNTTIPVELNVSLVNQADNSTHIVIIRDLSHRNAIAQERNKLAKAVGQIGEGVVITDTAGIIEYVNASFCTITQYTEEEIIGKNINILRSGQHEQDFYRQLWETITTKENWSGTMINKRKDGSLYHEHTFISPILDSFGKLVNFVAVKRDITNDILIERKMRQSQKLQAIGTLAGGIAHDFNNLLMGMSVFTELALNDLAPDCKIAEYLNQVRSEQLRAMSLIEKILLFSSQKEGVVHEIKIKETALDILDVLRATLPVTLEMETKIADVGKMIMDPTHLQQILINLCTNANYAMQGRGKLSIVIKNANVYAPQSNNHKSNNSSKWLSISVSDTGTGIDSKTLERIFEPFYTTKPVGEGTGLGLATVHGIVEKYNGTIEVDSVINQGTTFRIHLPVN